MKGFFLALEGIDGAGKSSQLTLLSNYFAKGRRRVKTLHFPRLSVAPYGEMIAAFLRGEYGAVDAVHPRLAALLYALDRREAAQELRDALAEGDVLIVDRYFFSNIAYQCAKVADPVKRKQLADWIEMLEYGHNAIPRPDLTLYFDVPLDFSLGKLANQRAGKDRDYLNGAEDIHESSQTLQERVRDEFLAMAKERKREIAIVDCRDFDGKMADKATIHNRVIDALRYYQII